MMFNLDRIGFSFVCVCMYSHLRDLFDSCAKCGQKWGYGEREWMCELVCLVVMPARAMNVEKYFIIVLFLLFSCIVSLSIWKEKVIQMDKMRLSHTSLQNKYRASLSAHLVWWRSIFSPTSLLMPSYSSGRNRESRTNVLGFNAGRRCIGRRQSSWWHARRRILLHFDADLG